MPRSVFISGSCYKIQIIRMLLDHKTGDDTYTRAKDFESTDILLYTGGADVSPSLYGEKPLMSTSCDTGQDTIDAYFYHKAVEQNKMIVGICRGAQFINVLNGGRLWQDVSRHALRGGKKHEATDVESGRAIMVSSLHHQECILAKDGIPLLTAKEAAYKRTEKVTWQRRMNPSAQDMEAFWYPKTFCLGFQPHPEIDSLGSPGRNLFFQYIDRFWKERETTLKVSAVG